MKQITIYSNEFSIPDNSYSFLSKYLDRITKFINSNNLDIDLLNDIEERISEKFFSIIEGGNEIGEKDVIDIVNEIGEPEDIFKDFINKKETNNQNSSDFSQKVKSTLKAKLYKNSKKGVLLGVCQGFGEYFEINPVWIRILFLFMFFFYGTGILIYIILGIILPEKDEEVGLDLEKNISKAADRVKEVAQSGVFANFFHAVGRFISKIFSIIGRLIGFGFIGIIGIILFFTGFFGIISSAFISNSYTINNEILFYYLPQSFIYSCAIFSVIIFLFGIITIASALKKSLINGYILFVLFIILAFSGFGITSGIFKIISAYTNEYSKEMTYELGEIQSGSVIKVSPFDKQENIFDLHFDNHQLSFKIIETDSQKVEATIKTKIRANDSFNGNMILNNLNPFIPSIKNNELSFAFNGLNYKTPQPFSFLAREILLKIPKNISLDIRGLGYREIMLDESNLDYSDEMIKYGVGGCYYSIIKYDFNKQKLVCNDIGGVNRAKLENSNREGLEN